MQFSRNKSAFRVLAAVSGLALLMPLSAASTASAAVTATCTSEVQATRDYLDSAGVLAATLYWYSGSNGVCAKLVARGKYYGMSKYMSLSVWDSDHPAKTTDAGTFKYYAGPLSRNVGCMDATSVMKNAAGATIMNHTTAFSCN
jgi:hypothetical protein